MSERTLARIVQDIERCDEALRHPLFEGSPSVRDVKVCLFDGVFVEKQESFVDHIVKALRQLYVDRRDSLRRELIEVVSQDLKVEKVGTEVPSDGA